MKRPIDVERARHKVRTRFYLPGSSSLVWGGWVGVLADGSETIDFGKRQEAEDCAAYYQAIEDRYAEGAES